LKNTGANITIDPHAT